MNKRQQIFDAINTEREYQIKRWGFRNNDGSFAELMKNPEQFVLYMEDYLHEARHQLSRLPEPEASDKALLSILKVVTMGVACFEMWHVPQRDPNVPVINGNDGLPA